MRERTMEKLGFCSSNTKGSLRLIPRSLYRVCEHPRGRQRPSLTMQHRPILESRRTCGVLAVTAALVALGCTPAEENTTATTVDSSAEDPSGDPTSGTEAETEDPTATETGDPDTDSTDDTTDPTGETDGPTVREVPCEAPGTMVWSGDIYIDEVADISMLDGHIEITGDLKIYPPDLDNLDFLACITTVGGNIQVYNTQITDLGGLINITELAGSLSISDNPNLEYVYGFDGLTRIGSDGPVSGALVITKNESLRGIYGFQGLQQIELGINIDENPILERVEGLANLVAVGTEPGTGGNYPDLSVAYNPELASIDGLIGIQALGGQLVIQANPKLCISDIMSLADMLEQWVQEGMGDTSGNNGDC